MDFDWIPAFAGMTAFGRSPLPAWREGASSGVDRGRDDRSYCLSLGMFSSSGLMRSIGSGNRMVFDLPGEATSVSVCR